MGHRLSARWKGVVDIVVGGSSPRFFWRTCYDCDSRRKNYLGGQALYSLVFSSNTTLNNFQLSKLKITFRYLNIGL